MVEIDHDVVERGLFRWVWHPSYTGVLLAFVGWALTLGNWRAMLVVLMPILAAFSHRMNVEEEELSQALGERYSRVYEADEEIGPFIYSKNDMSRKGD